MKKEYGKMHGKMKIKKRNKGKGKKKGKPDEVSEFEEKGGNRRGQRIARGKRRKNKGDEK